MFSSPPKYLVALLLVLFLGGCLREREVAEKVPPTTFPPKPVKQAFYRFPLPSDPPTLDPAHVTDTVSDTVAKRIFEGLVKFSPELKIVPCLAEKWSISADGLSYKFYLREGVKFHNGRGLTSEDFVYSFTRVLSKEVNSERAQMLFPVKGAVEFYEGKSKLVEGIEAPDALTVKITLKEPYAPFLSVLAMVNFSAVPKEVVEEKGEAFAQHPVGTGPFVFDSWQRDNEVVLKANKAYWDGEPRLSTVIFKVLPDENTRFQAFINGDLEHTDIPFGKMAEIMKDEKLKKLVVGVPAMDMYCYGFNTRKPPFDNKLVRLAFNYAVDKEAIVRNILEDRGEVQKTYVPRGMFYFKEDSEGYPYNPQKAVKLLERAGYPGGVGFPPVVLSIDQQLLSKQIAQFVQEDLRKIGVKVQIEQSEWGTFLDRVYAGELSFHQNTWLTDYPDPDNWLYVLLESSQAGAPGNITRFSHKDFDKLVRKARKSLNENERKYLYSKAEDIALASAPWLLLYWRKNLTLVQPYVKGLTITAMDRTPQLNNTPLEKVYLEE